MPPIAIIHLIIILESALRPSEIIVYLGNAGLKELLPSRGGGGLVPAAIVARELDLRLVDTVCVASYEHKDQGNVEILKSVEGDGDGWLIVDDLVDTGVTAQVVRDMLPKAHFATIYAKPAGRPLVDTFITEVSQDTWILFPWDVEPAYAKPIREQV